MNVFIYHIGSHTKLKDYLDSKEGQATAYSLTFKEPDTPEKINKENNKDVEEKKEIGNDFPRINKDLIENAKTVRSSPTINDNNLISCAPITTSVNISSPSSAVIPSSNSHSSSKTPFSPSSSSRIITPAYDISSDIPQRQPHVVTSSPVYVKKP
jgi:hypothetical protein